MRKFLRQSVAVAVTLAFSAQSLGAESLALMASPNAAARLMPPPAALAQLPVQSPSFKREPPKIVPPADWGYYVLATAEIFGEIGGELKFDAMLAAAFAQGLYKGVSEGLSSRLSEPAPEAYAPIDLPAPSPSVIARIPEPEAKYTPLDQDEAPPQDRMLVRAPSPGPIAPRSFAPRPIPTPQMDRTVRGLEKVARLYAEGKSLDATAGDSMEIRSDEFESKILGVGAPALVMFNATRNCHCAEQALRELKAQWRGNPSVHTMNAQDSPALARKYGVTNHSTLLLFKNGGLAKREDAAAMEQRVMARHGGRYDNADMKAEITAFTAPPRHKIQLYSTSWCHYCKLAHQYLNDRGIAFEEFDVEKDAAAKAQYETYHQKGYPLAVIDGKPVLGFRADEYARLLN